MENIIAKKKDMEERMANDAEYEVCGVPYRDYKNKLQEALRKVGFRKKSIKVTGCGKTEIFHPHDLYTYATKLYLQGEGMTVHSTTEIEVGDTAEFVETSPGVWEHDKVMIEIID